MHIDFISSHKEWLNAQRVNSYIAKVRVVQLSAYEGSGEKPTHSFFPLLAERSKTDGLFCGKLPLSSCFFIWPLYTREKNAFTVCSSVRLWSSNFSLKKDEQHDM